MTSLALTVPESVEVEELESEIVTALVDRLRDDPPGSFCVHDSAQ